VRRSGSVATNPGERRPLSVLVRRGLELCLRNLPVAFATVGIAVAEPFLPRLQLAEVPLASSTWDIGHRTLSGLDVPIGATLLALTIVNAFLSCWFTSVAFDIRGLDGRRLQTPFLSYVVRAFVFQAAVNVLLGAIGLALVWMASSLLFPVSPFAEKAVVLLLAILALPLVVMLFSFSLYWAFCHDRYADIGRAVFESVRTIGGRAYWFFGLTIGTRLGGAIAAILILRTPIPYPLQIAAVAVIVAAIGMLLRGVKFEYQHWRFAHGYPPLEGEGRRA
jgi:hypothetical protein